MEGLVLIQDSREQSPLVFKGKYIVQCMSVGDYGAKFSERYQYPLVFERKGKGDLFGTLSKGYERFKKEIRRAEEQGIKIVIAIEGTKERILRGYSHSKRNGCSIVLQLETIKERYRVDHIYFPSRISMANYIEKFYQVEYEKYLETFASLPEEI